MYPDLFEKWNSSFRDMYYFVMLTDGKSDGALTGLRIHSLPVPKSSESQDKNRRFLSYTQTRVSLEQCFFFSFIFLFSLSHFSVPILLRFQRARDLSSYREERVPDIYSTSIGLGYLLDDVGPASSHLFFFFRDIRPFTIYRSLDSFRNALCTLT